MVYNATNSLAKTKVVSILFAKHSPVIITEVLTDQEGRFLFVKGSLFSRPITLANLYCPNEKQVSFLDSVVNKLSTFQSSMLILGGDLHKALQPFLDTFTGSSSLPYRVQRKVHLLLQDLLLHNKWRTLNPNTCDYTFFSTPHNRHSRLDYLFFSQSDLCLLSKATREPYDHIRPQSNYIDSDTTRTIPEH